MDAQLRLGEAIRAARRSLGVSQEAFADAIGLHRTFIGLVERGEASVSVSNLLRIADGLGIRAGDLLNSAFPEPAGSRAGTDTAGGRVPARRGSADQRDR